MKATAVPCLTKPVKELSDKAKKKRASKIAEIKAAESLAKRCLTKHAYKSKARALEIASRQMDRVNSPSQLRAYRCHDCGMWHLTKKGNV